MRCTISSKRRESIKQKQLDAQLAQERLDVTLPGRGQDVGGIHPITRTTARVEALFAVPSIPIWLSAAVMVVFTHGAWVKSRAQRF